MNALSRLGVRSRLALGFAAVLLMCLATIALSLWRLATVAETTREMMKVPLTKERLIADWNLNINAGVRRASAIAKSSDPSLVDFFAEDNTVTTKQSSEYQKSIEALLSGESEKALFAEIGTARKAYLSSRDNILKAKKEGRAEEAQQMLEQNFLPASKLFLAKIHDLQVMQRQSIDAMAANVDTTYQRSFRVLVALGVLALSFGVLMTWLITRSIRMPLYETVEAMERVAKCDLTARITPDAGQTHELARLQLATMSMVHELSSMLATLKRQSDQLTQAAGTLSDASVQVKQGSDAQSEATTSMAASLEQMSTSIAQVSQLGVDARQMCEQAEHQAQDGMRVVHTLARDVGGIATAIQEASSTATQLGKDSERISGIATVIKEVANQTNLLALNAAIEAARAGEQGRGFAVVADEVRKLAEKTGQSAQEIADMITSIQGSGQAMAEQMEISVQRVTEGVQMARTTQDSIQTINDGVVRLLAVISDVSAALEEQSSASQDIAGRVEKIVQMIEENNQSMSSVADIASDLDAVAGHLKQDISRFRLAN